MSDLPERIDLGTWAFLRTGWWVLHVAAIIAVAYIGFWLHP